MQRGYLQALSWFLAVCAISCVNDVLVKAVGGRLDPIQVAFFRFFFSTLTLFPLMLASGVQSFFTQRIRTHMIRAVLLFLAISPWCYGVAFLPLSLATTISFTTPLFVLPMASIFLGEKVGWQRTLATLLGFLGILVSIHPSVRDFNFMALVLVISTFMFATLDIINKRLLNVEEGLLPMMFYSALGTTLLGTPFAVFVWQTPTMMELFFLLLLGCGANGILYCLLRAFRAYDISALQPVRYAELLFSCAMGWLVFQEWPHAATLMGAALIIPSTAYLAYYERRYKESTESRPA